MSPRGILKSPRAFPPEHELSETRRTRSRSRSRDHLRVDEALQLVPSGHERHSGSQSSRRSAHSRRRSKSRSPRHVQWSDPIAFVVSDGTDVLALRQLRQRRASLPSILEDTRTHFKESLRDQEKNPGRSTDRDSSSSRRPPDTVHPSVLSHSWSSHRRPTLKPTLSTPDVGRSPKPSDPKLHTPTPISHEHRRRRVSLPNGLEAAVKSPSHALWLPHHAESSSERSTSHSAASHANDYGSSHSKSSKSASQSRQATHGHTHARSSGHSHSHSHSMPQTPRHYEAAQLPHAYEQPQPRGATHPAPPHATFTSQHPPSASRPLSQMTTSTLVSSKSSSSEKKSPPLPSPVPTPSTPAPAKPINEPQTPKSTRSTLFSFPTIDDIFSKDETSHSLMSVRRLFGLSTPKHEPRELSDEDKPTKKHKHSREPSKESHRHERGSEAEHRHRKSSSYLVSPPPQEPLHRSRHSFDLGTFSLLDDMHMRWTTATARHFLPVLTPAEIQASHLTLSLNPTLTTIYWDIRHPPNAVWSVIPGRKTTLWTGHHEPATVPLVPSLRIFSPYFLWVISARNPAGVTCGDILSAIHSSALQLVWRGEFDKLRSADKSRLAAGYHANRPAKGEPKTAESPFDAGSWLMRADWLGRYTVLRGMSVSEAKDKHGAPAPDVLLSMYLTENRREADSKALVLLRH